MAMARRAVWTTVLIGATLVPAGSAGAAGWPLVGVAPSGNGLVAFGGGARWVARPAGHDTRVQRLPVSGSGPVLSGLVRGRFEIPVVTETGATSGVSADGSRLALISPRDRFPQAATSLAILDASSLRVDRSVRLNGDFSFDAISPTGSWIYLIEYLSRDDPSKYKVRALETATGRLDPKPVVDPHDGPQPMRGYPLKRTMSRDGAWAYTLYDGQGHPFIHALDTAHRRAVCIDLPRFWSNTNLGDAPLTLSPDGSALKLVADDGTAALIDTRSFRVSEQKAAPRPAPPARRAPQAQDDGVALGLAVAALAVILGGGALAWRRRHAHAAYG
jgi:hypothetical protein